ncbi:MAG: hypothetical protein EAZ70_07665 [Runella slithyformis]|nr:MAG: hypothetical protein EAY79_07010 [Runella slithyformis]TAF27211.1 MAG: hypothetical protein EAZ70_07665 [Runella slithyformis]TAF45859.1 MAG: hypothetical protein EAZ63_10470 [Runella slithyformis]TAF80686.1 MAG: hypothetical protein EAZ50_08285 [Runella slithyformis]
MWQKVVSAVLYVCVIVGLVCYRQIKPHYLRVFVIWFAVWALADISLYLFYGYFPNGRLVRGLYCLLDPFHFWVYGFAFVLVRQPPIGLRYAFWSIFGAFLLFSFYQIIFRIDDRNAATDTFLLKSFLILVMVLYYFWQLISPNKILKINETPIFWIATASLFYFAGNVIATGLFHQLIQNSKQWATTLYKLNYILEIVVYLFAILAFVLASKKESQ